MNRRADTASEAPRAVPHHQASTCTHLRRGLLRQYFPKRTDLKPYSQEDLDTIAAELNGRPRKTLQFMTPSEKFAEAVAVTP